MKLSTKTMKIVSILIIAVMVIFLVGSSVMAEGITSADDLMKNKGDDTLSEVTGNFASGILQAIQVAGIAFAVAMLIFVAIKYLTASAEGKAEIKKYAVGYIVGAIVLFGVSGIIGIIQTFTNQTLDKSK